ERSDEARSLDEAVNELRQTLRSVIVLHRDIRGDLRARIGRADLTLEGILGRVDVENAFGKAVWRADRLIAGDLRSSRRAGPSSFISHPRTKKPPPPPVLPIFEI